MIQRIQSVYLVLAAIAVGAAPFVGGSAAPVEWKWHEPVMLVIAVVAALVSITAVFLYKQRPRQRGLVVADQFVVLILIGLALAGTWVGGPELNATVAAGVALPVLSYGLLFMAKKSIQKDIELVRSMDRLR